ncbi:MAG TPA: hypothetical protein VKV16_06210 [Solirubrobacteraceae bacterium]|nr:hypothetical protein [Solirubrobacteraceae bacterium]
MLPPRRRRLLRALLALAALLCLLVGGVLARWLTVENLERDEDLALVQAEARGDVAGMLDRLGGCRAKRAECVALVEQDAGDARLRRSGAVKILQLESSTAYSLGAASGETRLAWTVIGSPPVVQCVAVRRSGNVLTGIHVQLLSISAPIAGEGKCTKATPLEEEEEEATEVEEGKHRS